MERSRIVRGGRHINDCTERPSGPMMCAVTLASGAGMIFLIAHAGGKLNVAIVHQRLDGRGYDHLAGRLQHQPAQQLLPEKIVAGSPSGWLICHRHVPEVAIIAVRPRP